ncbi:GNAT family N-acetyltransferase [Sinorhizobium meliloti]|uniref:GNAT family N-acetyltransferase n=1 Tax=Rhizobium meliloti TaxID=382 RepID=UPI000B498940|nr:GNAT family N-acetyltransferase [Sinorhizobium meliloti]ASP84777.1 GNAT family N-acetyltransferase [Sinorhizobium meliloti]MQW27082.1 GNAT family N-acetyltransferase [Sinorhizobium meliloti]
MKLPSENLGSEGGPPPYRIQFYENCSQSPASRLVPQASTYLEESGFALGRRGPHPPVFTDPCVAAIDEDGRAIGFMIYRGEMLWNIDLSYVVPEHRRKGIHTALFDALVDKGLQKGNIVSINCMTHANNLAAQAAFEAQGRTKEYIMYSYRLKDEIVGIDRAEEMRLPEYLVEPFDTGPDGLKSMQAFINEKAAEGYEVHQVIERSTYQWVLIFRKA